MKLDPGEGSSRNPLSNSPRIIITTALSGPILHIIYRLRSTKIIVRIIIIGGSGLTVLWHTAKTIGLFKGEINDDL